MHRLRAAIKKEFLQFIRDWMLIALILFTYTVEIAVCTYALTFEVTNLSIAVHDDDGTQASRELIERFTASRYFGKASDVGASAELDRLLDSGEIDLGIVIPSGFASDITSGTPTGIQVLVSGTNTNTAVVSREYVHHIVDDYYAEVLTKRMRRTGWSGEAPRLDAVVHVWYNPELNFRYFMVISMIVVAALLVGTIHVAATMVREKDSGTMEQILVTPLRRHEIIISKMTPTLAIGLFGLVPSLLVARWFALPMRGSLALFVAATAIALFSSMGIGTYISTVSRNLQQALLLSFFVLFPLMFLSGTVIPIEEMPAALQYLSWLSPIRYYMEIAVGIFLKGTGIAVLWPQFLYLAAFGAVILPLSLRRLGRRVYD